MFRRNRPQRFSPRIGQRPLAQPALRALNQAHNLMATGAYLQAAELFSQLARGAQSLARPQQAANLHAQAGLAWAEAGQGENALKHGRTALRGFIALAMLPRFNNYLMILTDTLKEKGMGAAADELQAEFANQAMPQPKTEAVEPARPRLPGVCPRCGAPLRSDQVEWIDDFSAACVFCGSVVQGE